MKKIFNVIANFGNQNKQTEATIQTEEQKENSEQILPESLSIDRDPFMETIQSQVESMRVQVEDEKNLDKELQEIISRSQQGQLQVMQISGQINQPTTSLVKKIYKLVISFIIIAGLLIGISIWIKKNIEKSLFFIK